jgi:hypothetical protein
MLTNSLRQATSGRAAAEIGSAADAGLQLAAAAEEKVKSYRLSALDKRGFCRLAL